MAGLLQDRGCDVEQVGLEFFGQADWVMTYFTLWYGEMIPQDDIDQLTRSFRTWVANPDTLAARRLGARRRVQESYDIAILSERVWHEYELLSHGAPSSPS